eukprot:TRINITY_DN2156_c0_g1::TRINITY_DN2156_c0_g1_i1::g.12897::m.12897 TRINITY_DN2156_c0_g1::TRINITY_DN2156_c0_g1_i1::g.12897  ORF type:complete len:157 (+),score=30.96,sp/Q871K1/QCR7_NEUCR/37.63/2e-07,UCR_14kD/PF02271.11/2.2e-14 TRINITY_DN2156_c0_g1_i1:49-471(+)
MTLKRNTTRYVSAIQGILNSNPVTKSAFDKFRSMYQASAAGELKRFGLVADDLISDDHYTVQEAIRRCDPREIELRQKRIHRAAMLFTQGTELHHSLQNYDAFRPYLYPLVAQVQQEAYERRNLLEIPIKEEFVPGNLRW